jgi:hypothetical protein
MNRILTIVACAFLFVCCYPQAKFYDVEVYDSKNKLILSSEDYIKEEMYYENSYENLIYAQQNESSSKPFSQIFLNLKQGRSTEFLIKENQYFVV